MCDVLPAHATMTPRLTLGYREAVALTPSPLHPEGARCIVHFGISPVAVPASVEPGSTDTRVLGLHFVDLTVR